MMPSRCLHSLWVAHCAIEPMGCHGRQRIRGELACRQLDQNKIVDLRQGHFDAIVTEKTVAWVCVCPCKRRVLCVSNPPCTFPLPHPQHALSIPESPSTECPHFCLQKAWLCWPRLACLLHTVPRIPSSVCPYFVVILGMRHTRAGEGGGGGSTTSARKQRIGQVTQKKANTFFGTGLLGPTQQIFATWPLCRQACL